jgi:3-phosphoshikimate 1-carboxyvinyltransferase
VTTSFTVAGGRPLRGRLRVPGDKSISHRALLLAALAEGTSIVRGLSEGDDVARTRDAVAALGATIEGERITGGVEQLHEPDAVIDVGNSGTSMRLLTGFCAPRPFFVTLTGDVSIARRPMARVVEPLRRMGCRVDGRDDGRYPPLALRGGGLHGIDYELPVASAQVKGALLLAGLGADGETIVREHVPTRVHTEEMLAAAGADISISDDGAAVRVRPSKLEPFVLDVPGDPSQAAFWVVAACTVPGSAVVVEDVYAGPARVGFVDVLRRMGADLEVEWRDERTADLVARFSPGLHGTEIGGAEVPGLVDEIPVLAVAAACADGETVVRDASELRVKESDRVATMAAALRAMGAEVEPRHDGLVIAGRADLRGAPVDASGDHRVAMAMAIAGLAAEGTTRIDGWESVRTSYPAFEADLATCAS